MATFSGTTSVIAAARPPQRAQLRVARANTFRCAYSKEGLKGCSAMNLPPAVLKGMGLRWSWRPWPWGPELIEEQMYMEKEDTTLRRSSSAGLAQPRVARAEKLRRGYSKENMKALSALNLSPAVLKGMGLRRVSRPWGSELVEERMDPEDT
jgi:hypothetical protein